MVTTIIIGSGPAHQIGKQNLNNLKNFNCKLLEYPAGAVFHAVFLIDCETYFFRCSVCIQIFMDLQKILRFGRLTFIHGLKSGIMGNVQLKMSPPKMLYDKLLNIVIKKCDHLFLSD